MPGMRTQLFGAVGILLLVPFAQSAAQQVQPSEPIPPRQENTEERLPTTESEVEAAEPRRPLDSHIETDRDAFTPSTRIAPRNRWIMESSYSFIDNRGLPDTNSFPELLLRYGLFRRVELRLGWNYESGAGGSVVTGESGESAEGVDTPHRTQEQRLLYGLKASLTAQKSWLPDSIAILQGYTPTGGSATATQFVATYAYGWRLPNRWRFDSAVRFATDSDNGNRFQVWAPSTVLRVPLGERFQVHAEYFGLFSQNRAIDFSQSYISPGLHYLITPNLEVGLRLGWGLNEQAAAFFSNVGFGLRF